MKSKLGLPGPMLEELIFLHLVSKDVIKRFQFPDESEDDPQKREVYRDGHKELPEDIGEEREEKDQENEDDDQEDKDEDWDEAKKEQEDDNADQDDLTTTMNRLQL